MKLCILIITLFVPVLALIPAYAIDNVHFSGALVAEPCTLPDTDTDIHVDFGTVVEKYLYQNERTKDIPFTIHLEDCDTNVMNTVSVTFDGVADDELTDMLALDASSTGKGMAIGMELPDGSPLVINKATSYKQLTQGSNELTFDAFVQIKPTVLNSKLLVAGDFSAISTFVLSYQ